MMEKEMAFFLWENVCSYCFGSGTYLDERCRCKGGFSAGLRWYIVEIPEDIAANTLIEDFTSILGNHLKTGHTLSLQNRPTGLAEDVIVLPCRGVHLQGAI